MIVNFQCEGKSINYKCEDEGKCILSVNKYKCLNTK